MVLLYWGELGPSPVFFYVFRCSLDISPEECIYFSFGQSYGNIYNISSTYD